MPLGNIAPKYDRHSITYVRNQDGACVGFECSCGIWYYTPTHLRNSTSLGNYLDRVVQSHEDEHERKMK